MTEYVPLVERWKTDRWAAPESTQSFHPGRNPDAAADPDERPRDAGTGRFKKKGAPDTFIPDLPDLPWEDPSPPRGKGGERGQGGMVDGVTKSELGEVGELLASKFGIERSHREVKNGKVVRQAAMDHVQGDTWAFECKLRQTTAKEYRVGMKDWELDSKKNWCRQTGRRSALIVVVYDPPTKTAMVYWRTGLENGRPGDGMGEWKFAGKVKRK